jgi:hypothetical protein
MMLLRNTSTPRRSPVEPLARIETSVRVWQTSGVRYAIEVIAWRHKKHNLTILILPGTR